jgi:Thioredoxin-like domain
MTTWTWTARNLGRALLAAAWIGASALGAARAATPPDADGIAWLPGYTEALKDAAHAGRPTLIVFTYHGCAPCDELKQHTLPDPGVVEDSRSFSCVLLDRDADKDLAQRFHIFAFPSVLVIGPAEENIYRWDGVRPPAAFRAELKEALRRYALFQKGEEWTTPPTRPDKIVPIAASVETIRAPAYECGTGIAFVEGDMFVIQGGGLFRLDPASGKVKAQFGIPMQMRDLCTDGTLLYLLPWGWSKGDPILVVDPATGTTVTEIVTERNKAQKALSAMGIEWYLGELYVLADRGRIYIVDPATGRIRLSMDTKIASYGLAKVGDKLVTVNQKGFFFLTPGGQIVRTVPSNYPLGSVAWKDGYFYVMESEVRGFDKQHNPVRVWPKQVLIYKLTLP